MKQLLLLFSALTLVCCSRQEVIDTDTVSILNLTKTQQDDIIVEHIIVHSDRYELTLTEQQAYEKGVAKVNYKLHKAALLSASQAAQKLIAEGKSVGLLQPISQRQYQTKCNECSPNVIALSPMYSGSDTYEFTSGYTCISIFGNFTSPGVNYIYGNLYITDLDGEANPSCYIGSAYGSFSCVFHKHNPYTANAYQNAHWRMRISAFTIAGPVETIYYSNLSGPCI